MRHTLKGAGIALLVSLFAVSGRPAMAWYPQASANPASSSVSVKDKWPPRDKQAVSTATPPYYRSPITAQKSEHDRQNNPWARKAPYGMSTGAPAKRPWGDLPPTTERKTKPEQIRRGSASHTMPQPPYYPGSAYPRQTYPPYAGPAYAAPYPGFGGYGFPNSSGPWPNNGSMGNGFPMNNFPFSFW